MKTKTTYNASLNQGTSVLNETLLLLDLYKSGMTSDEMLNFVVEKNYLSTTERRARNLVKEVFYPRLVNGNPNRPLWLQQIRQKGLLLYDFVELLMIYCARVNALYYDFILDILNPYRCSEKGRISRQEIDLYVESIIESNAIQWSDSTKRTTATRLFTATIGFNQCNRKGELLPFKPCDFTVLYLMHELHFMGLSDIAISEDSDWSLFGMQQSDVIGRILELSLRGGYIAQHTGDLLTISWKYKSMEEFIDATL